MFVIYHYLSVLQMVKRNKEDKVCLAVSKQKNTVTTDMLEKDGESAWVVIQLIAEAVLNIPTLIVSGTVYIWCLPILDLKDMVCVRWKKHGFGSNKCVYIMTDIYENNMTYGQPIVRKLLQRRRLETIYFYKNMLQGFPIPLRET